MEDVFVDRFFDVVFKFGVFLLCVGVLCVFVDFNCSVDEFDLVLIIGVCGIGNNLCVVLGFGVILWVVFNG